MLDTIGVKKVEDLFSTIPAEVRMDGPIDIKPRTEWELTAELGAMAEANCDDKGLSWPAQIAPFDVHVLATGKGDEVFETAQSLGEELDAAGLDVLVDDRRKVSAGVKFKDYELVGVPFGLVVGRSLADGEVEIRVRATGETIVVPVEEAVARLRELHAAALKGE